MRLLIFGATGKTGRQLLAQGLQQGFIITAFVRNSVSLPIKEKNLSLIQGNILNLHDIEKAIDGQDAVISVLGNKTSQALWQSNTTISDGLKNILTGMKKYKVKRLLFVTSFGVSNNIFFPEKLFIRTILKNIFADISRQEMLIKASDLDYTIVRPARLTNGARTGKYKVGVDLPIGISSQISRADVADFLLKSIDDKSTTKKVITVCY